MIKNTDKDKKRYKTEFYMKVNIKMGWDKERENTFGLMECTIKEIFMMVKCKAMDN